MWSRDDGPGERDDLPTFIFPEVDEILTNECGNCLGRGLQWEESSSSSSSMLRKYGRRLRLSLSARSVGAAAGSLCQQ